MYDSIRFWDRNINSNEIKKILRDESHPRFIEFTALFLSRTNKTKEVFSKYLNKVTFCRNWNKIKRQMRKDKWNNMRIVFWDAVYQAIVKKMDKKQIHPPKIANKPINRKAEKIGGIIRAARKAKKWTQKDLATHVKISPRLISLIERGRHNFSFETFIKISAALNIKISIEPEGGYNHPASASSTSTYADL